MAERLQRDRIIPALSAGNVVTVAIQLFRQKGDDYLTTSLQSYLWIFLTFLGAGLLGGGGYVIGQAMGLKDWNQLSLLVGILALIPLAYGRGRKTAAGGGISRIIFNKLVSRSETKEDIQTKIFSRTWAYFRGELWFWLALTGLFFGFFFVLGMILETFFSSFQESDISDFLINAEANSDSMLASIIAVIILIILFYIGMVLFFSYFVARLWLFDVVMALEDATAIQAIRRSWQLTRKHGRQSLAVVSICSLLMMPPYILSSLLSVFSIFGTLFIIIASFPLYQAVKAVIYYDLRSRNEGLTFDLEFVATNPTQHLRRVILQTPESIELDLALGGIGSRTWAWVIDQLLLWIGIGLFWYFGSIFYLTILLPLLTTSFPTFANDVLDQWITAIASLLTFALSNSYFIAFETLWKGQTPGKRAAKIRVVRDSGQPVGIKESSLRSLLSVVDLFCFLGMILMVTSKSEKRLGDLVAGTLVIQDQQQGTQLVQTPFEFSRNAEHLAAKLSANANLKRLTPDQFLTLRDFLGYQSGLASGMRSQITTKLANQIRQLLEQNNQPFTLEIDDLDLVEATYLACQQANQA